MHPFLSHTATCFIPLQVELQPSLAIPCIVSFSPGQERRVYFSVAGAALSSLPSYSSGEPFDAALAADPRASMMHSSASVVLADPAPTRLNAGDMRGGHALECYAVWWEGEGGHKV